jgi:hypothetical protein
MQHAASAAERPLVAVTARTFRGQLPGERLILRTHPARARLWLPAWPVALGLAASLTCLIIAAGGSVAAQVGLGSAGLATVAALGYWLCMAAYPWWRSQAIITDHRLIWRRGGAAVAEAEIRLATVQSARVEVRTFGEWLLGFGRVTLSAAGGDPLTIADIPRPQAFVNLVMQAHAPHTVATVAPADADPAVQAIIGRLAQPTPLPAMPALDPAITSHWPLRHAMTIPLEDGETVLGQIARHWWRLARHMVAPVVLLASAPLVLLVAWLAQQPQLGWLAVAPLLVGALWCLLAYLTFVDDSFILTNRRILSVNRRFFLLFEAVAEIDYGAIQEVTLTIPGGWARLARFGTVTLAVGGTAPPVVLNAVPRPQAIKDAIDACCQAIRRRAEVAAANQEKRELRGWFSAVVGEMVVAAPDLCGKPLETALTAAYAVGLRLIVQGDSIIIPGLPAGIVVAQQPFPGSRALRGGDITVLLSRTEW